MDTSDKWFALDTRRGPIWGSRGREFKSRQPDEVKVLVSNGPLLCERTGIAEDFCLGRVLLGLAGGESECLHDPAMLADLAKRRLRAKIPELTSSRRRNQRHRARLRARPTPVSGCSGPCR